MTGTQQIKYTHLIAAAMAIAVTSGILAFGTGYASSLEQRYIHALALLMPPESGIGSALQQAAFRQPDLLVVYGSSEMLKGSAFRADQLFQNYPTGFNVYDVAKGGATSLDIAQALAAIGPELRGKKVVFSFTPSMFIASEVAKTYYAGDFSPLHANALIFSPDLSLETKQVAAERMNEYPDTLRPDPLLQFAVSQLACKCDSGVYLYDLAAPLGRLHTWVIRLQDHWAVLSYIWSHPGLKQQVPHTPAPIDWNREITQAVATDKANSSSNPYGIGNLTWTKEYSKVLAAPRKLGSADGQFEWNLKQSKEWTDFALALRVLKELGAKPLILSRPIDGPIWNAMGVSWRARREYYDKLQGTISPYHFPFVDFANHDGDPYFSYDQASHTSPEGWVYIDQTLDRFYHGAIQ